LTQVYLFFIFLVLICIHHSLSFTAAMQITSTGAQTIQKAQGEAVVLGCTYTPGPTDTGELDIEWSNISPDMTQKDTLILSYVGGKQYNYSSPSLMKRLTFTAGNPSNGDASFTISNLMVSDTGTYQCKVKKAPGIDSRKVTLVVMVRPSVPNCWVEGSQEEGSAVSLQCKSSQGSTPLTYNWFREGGGTLPPAATANPQTGELLIRNHSQSFVGNYRCEVKNFVGKEQCVYSLQAYKSVNKAGVIAGAVIGALLLLLLLLLLIWLLICCCNKRRYEKEVANEIREDAGAPVSRAVTPTSSFRSVLGYRSHAGVGYNFVRSSYTRPESNTYSSIYKDKTMMIQSPSANSRPTTAEGVPSVKFSYSKYGYPV
uniref:V-set and immunoglobulin domain containing 8b n=1 Tax=Lepisosteus oculatus TaxID=7918 RepID=W5NGV2_LEPOC